MKIHPPDPVLGPIATLVAMQAYCLMPERDARDVANNVVGVLAMAADCGEEVDAQKAFTKRLEEMVRDFGRHPDPEKRFMCADVVMAGRLMAAEYRRQMAGRQARSAA
jgi:hypothetical protein